MNKLFRRLCCAKKGGKSCRSRSISRLSNGSNGSSLVIHLVRGAYNIDLSKVDDTFTKLHKACYLNQEAKKIRKYLRQGFDPNKMDNKTRSMPLHLATVHGNLQTIKLLLEYGADPDLQDGDGKTPLIKAIECFRHNCVQFFILLGCNLHLADFTHGNTPLHFSILNNYSLGCLFLLKYSQQLDINAKNLAGESCIHLLVRFPDLHKFIPDFLESGADIHIRDGLGRTPLALANELGHIDAVKMMVRISGRCLI